MIGLIMKDLFYIKNILIILFIFVAIISIAGIFLTDIDISPICVLLPVVFGSMVPTMILKDKHSKWEKYIYCSPCHKYDFGIGKYIVYLIMVMFSLAISVSVVVLADVIKNNIDFNTFVMAFCLGISVALLGGSILLPAILYLNEQKAIIFQMLTYFLAALVFVVATYVLDIFIEVNLYISEILAAYCLVSLLFYIISMLVYRKIIAYKTVF